MVRCYPRRRRPHMYKPPRHLSVCNPILIERADSYTKPVIWSTVELNVGITCACMPTVQPLLKATLGRFSDRVMAGWQKTNSNGSPAHHGDRQLLPGSRHFLRVLNTLGSLAGPSVSSDVRTTVGDTAVIEQVGHEPALPVTIHVKRDVDLEHGQQDV